ncbi:MAG: triphosphoribosyl-dephospho-CoA synthase [Planctomycetaceae bacterium]
MAPSPTGLWSRHLAESLRAACLVEATARKPGNVHPQASFADLTYDHFRDAAGTIAPILAQASRHEVGRTIRLAVEASRDVTATNANLGIILLLAPLAAVPEECSLNEGIGLVLARLTNADACDVYGAIRVARPGGLGQVANEDVSAEPTGTLRDVMWLAAERDSIARQYACGFTDVLEIGLPLLMQAVDFQNDWERAVIRLHLGLLAHRPDSLIVRKCGLPLGHEASRRAAAVLAAGWPGSPESELLLQEFDRWLRAEGNRRNPGTTADLVAAVLFAAFRERLLPVPLWAKLDSTEL